MFLFFSCVRIIRLTSPYLNCLIAVGAIILYINMYIYIVPATNMVTEAWLCNVSYFPRVSMCRYSKTNKVMHSNIPVGIVVMHLT